MMQYHKFALAAAFGFAFALVLSCGEHSWDDLFGDDSSSSVAGGSSGSKEGGSSSSGGGNGGSSGSSSSSGGVNAINGGCPNAVTDNGTVSCGGETYKTVVIGNQTWMARNLHYDVEGSKCGGDDGYLKDENTEYCDKYGRLYNWATAMGFPSKCTTRSSKGKDTDCAIKTPYHQGVCPSGWHIPDNAEWNELYRFYDIFIGTESNCTAEGDAQSPCDNDAAKYLKAKGSWYDCNPNGSGEYDFCQDTHGFSALPGGLGVASGNFYNADYEGYWRTSSEFGTGYAHLRRISYVGAGFEMLNKGYLLSVRCLKDASSGGSSSSGKGGGNIEGSLEYQGETYKTVVIGSQTWMARNLNYAVEGSKCGVEDRWSSGCLLEDENTEICDKYGRLYKWATAMALPSKCNSKFSSYDADCAIETPHHKGVCPDGWHIPRNSEWATLMTTIGKETALKQLRTKEGWNNCGPSGSGKTYSCEDTYGFSALPGGRGWGGDDGSDYSNYERSGSVGYWWTSTEDNALKAYSRGFGTDRDNAAYSYSDFEKRWLFSIRCLKD